MTQHKHWAGLAAFAGAASLALPGLAQAADGWTISGSMRVRYEAVAGQARPGFNAGDELVNLRTIIVCCQHRNQYGCHGYQIN